MGSPKTVIKYGALSALEATTAYGTAVTLTASVHGLDIITPPACETLYMHDGERAGKSPAERASRQRVGRMGRYGSAKLEYEPAGGGAAYDGTIVPNVHTALLSGGMIATMATATATISSVTYTPAPAGSEQSATTEIYYRGQQYPLAGCYSSWVLGSEIPGIPKLSCDVMGLFSSLPVDAALPTITYSAFKNPAKAEGVNLIAVVVVGTATATFTVGRIASFELGCANDIVARAHDNTANKHGGFNMGIERKFTLKASIESEALTTAVPYAATAGFNIFQLMEQAPTMALSFTVGGTQFYRYTISAPAAQLVSAPEQILGAASMWDLEFELKPTAL